MKITLEKSFEICKKEDVFLISDEVYGRMVYEDDKNQEQFFLQAPLIFVRKDQLLFIL